MADRQYVRIPIAPTFVQQFRPVWENIIQIINQINKVSYRVMDRPTYANNAAAVAGGLAVGDEYVTATGEVREVV